MSAAASADLDRIETDYGVVVEVSDTSGQTHVHAYTDDGDRIGFDLHGMNPVLEDVVAAATGIATLRNLANKRPRVGRPGAV